jgi:hypothetical protein
MTDEVKRGPGRPPKVHHEEAKHEGDTYEPVPPRRDPHSLDVRSADPEVTVTKPKSEPEPKAERLVEVEILRKYAPGGQPQEIKTVVQPGTVMELPVLEATRALKLQIARATDRTFDSDPHHGRPVIQIG